MYDFHMHSRVSFDGHDTGRQLVEAAERAGLKEICFTDHMDYTPEMDMVFDPEHYSREYDHLGSGKVLIRRGVEFGLLPDSVERMREDLTKRNYDFVIGSVHFVGDQDVYMRPYWQDKTPREAVRFFLEETLKCVQVHTDYDVLGHLLFISKSPENPTRKTVRYDDYRELLDEILRQVVCHGKGLEVNTSGVDRCGGYLPTMDYLRRFRELGGEIVTVGSDAHTASRVGQYCTRAAEEVKEIFGYVCTFENRRPIFHR